MEKLIVSPGFVKKIEDEQDTQDQAITSNSTAIAKLNSEENNTNDILASALSATRTMFFKGSGSAYTGSVPNANYGYGTFLVTVRGTLRFVTAFSQTNEVATNEYTGSEWRGWNELAKKSEVTTVSNYLQWRSSICTWNQYYTVGTKITLSADYDTYIFLSFAIGYSGTGERGVTTNILDTRITSVGDRFVLNCSCLDSENKYMEVQINSKREFEITKVSSGMQLINALRAIYGVMHR